MTTVSQRDGLTMGQALAWRLSGSQQLVPRDLVFPPEKSREDIQEARARTSELRGHRPVRRPELPELRAVSVEKVNDPGPSVGKLQTGDAIDKVDGTPVTSVEQFSGLLEATKPGQQIVVDYRRKELPARDRAVHPR